MSQRDVQEKAEAKLSQPLLANPGTAPSGKKEAAKKKGASARKNHRQFRSRKPKDMPRRPLSAYNIFFREERAKLLAARDVDGSTAKGSKIGFETMAKTIGKRWKDLTTGELGRYKELARADTERYRNEMHAYNRDLALKSRREREEASRRRMEEAGICQAFPTGLPPLPSYGIEQQVSGGETVGQVAGNHLVGHISAGPAPVPLPSTGMVSSAASRLDHLLAGAMQRPGLQAVHGFFSAAEKPRNALQEQLLLNRLHQQMPPNALQDQRFDNSRQHQDHGWVEGQLRQSSMPHQALANAPATSSNSLLSSFSHQCAHSTSQDLMSTLRQQLFIQSLQSRNPWSS